MLVLNSILAGYFGRLGGKAGLDTNLRDLGVPVFLLLSLPHVPYSILLCVYVLAFFALRTGYGETSILHKIVADILKQERFVFLFLGMIYSFCTLPLTINAHLYGQQILFSALSGVAVWGVHEYRFQLERFFIGDACDTEEFFRYFSIVLLSGVLWIF